MAITIWGLTIGDDGSGYVIPTYAQVREAFASRLRKLRGIAKLQTAPGTFNGDYIDEAVMGTDVALQGNLDAVSRTLFNGATGVALDQNLAGYAERVVATPSTATVYPYGTAGSNFGAGTAVRTSSTSTAFAALAGVVVPAAPNSVAYAVEVEGFGAGDYAGSFFFLTVDGVPVNYGAGGGDTGETVRDGLVALANALGGTQRAYEAGLSPTNGTYLLYVIERQGAGTFPLTVSGPPGAITAYPAIASDATTGSVTGPTEAPAGSLRVASLPAGIVGVSNPFDAVPGRARETDSQFRARWQVAQRGMGGGSPDAVRAILLADPAVGGGGATFAAVEYNPDDVIDADGNVPHSIRAIVNPEVDLPTVALALWKAKAAGDAMNGAVAEVIVDASGNNQDVLFDLLEDLWIAIRIEVEIDPGAWPNTGDPLAQLRQDNVDHVEAGGAGRAVRVNELPISLYPDGSPRGVKNFRVALGVGPTSAGPFLYNDYYPTPEDDAELASVVVTSRQRARTVITAIAAIIV